MIPLDLPEVLDVRRCERHGRSYESDGTCPACEIEAAWAEHDEAMGRRKPRIGSTHVIAALVGVAVWVFAGYGLVAALQDWGLL